MSNTDGGAAPAAATPSITEPTPADVMAFDPFGPKSTQTPDPATDAGKPGETGKPAEGDGAVPAGGQPGATPAPGTPASTTSTPATPAQVPPQDLSQLTAAIREAIATPKATPAAQDAPSAPKYNLALPPEMLNALRSEDPKEYGTAMHAVVNGIANKLWMDQMEYVQKELLPGINQLVLGHIQAQQQQQQVAQEFYSTYPQFQPQAIRTLVQQAGLVVAQTRQAAGKSLAWSPELAAEIAETVYQTVPQLRPAPGTEKKPNGSASKVPFSTGTGARPATAGAKTPADEMLELVKD